MGPIQAVIDGDRISASQSQPDDETDSLEKRARRLTATFGSSPSKEILDEAINRQFQGRIALVSSFGAESAVLLHLVASVNPQTPVIFLDTGKHFAQTLSYRKKLAREFGLENVIDVLPDVDEIAAEDPSGDLWNSNPDACCSLRKVRPLTSALDQVDAWITGRKQFHGGARTALPVFEASGQHVKVNPIVRWSKEELESYVVQHQLPPHPLVEHGYPSVGCWPCTHPSNDASDPRAGRWRGAAKTECGIHALAQR